MSKLITVLALVILVSSFSCRKREVRQQKTYSNIRTESSDSRIDRKMDRADQSMKNMDNEE